MLKFRTMDRRWGVGAVGVMAALALAGLLGSTAARSAMFLQPLRLSNTRLRAPRPVIQRAISRPKPPAPPVIK